MAASPPAYLTLDVDWAPDFVIDEVAQALIASGVRATWFITHSSPAIDRLAEIELFELGIHPNFLPGSSHGVSPDEVLGACLEVVPSARSMRTHGLVQSSELLELVVATTSIVIDASVFLPHADAVTPIEHWTPSGVLRRVPYVWDDHFEMSRPQPDWDPAAMLGSDAHGIRVFAFHPIHVHLNSAQHGPYHKLKRQRPRLIDATPDDTRAYVGSGLGARIAFAALVERLAAVGGGGKLCECEGAPA